MNINSLLIQILIIIILTFHQLMMGLLFLYLRRVMSHQHKMYILLMETRHGLMRFHTAPIRHPSLQDSMMRTSDHSYLDQLRSKNTLGHRLFSCLKHLTLGLSSLIMRMLKIKCDDSEISDVISNSNS